MDRHLQEQTKHALIRSIESPTACAYHLGRHHIAAYLWLQSQVSPPEVEKGFHVTLQELHDSRIKS